nr:heavy metal-associated isoprenylated plant protein 39-like [Ipomoea batatas]GMD38324.1 heavy metal-associated isoprenylated plant protein 39-like [Ipomoea batatas]
MLKTILPFEFVSECFNHTAPQNKSKAMQIAVGFHGVNSAGLQGEGKDELVVKGVFDPVELVALLRERQKVVIKLEVNGERPASLARRMGVGILKTMLPFECVSGHFKHSADQNKSKAMQIAVGFGVNSTALEGEGKDELVVKGVIDAAELVRVLRDKPLIYEVPDYSPRGCFF